MYRHKYGKEAYIQVPCGNCEACIERKSHEWAVRIYNEWNVCKSAHFFTLTYAEEHLAISPVTFSVGSFRETVDLPTLCKRDVQLFMKRLRKRLGNGLRFFLGAEYGETKGRPHYHFILFNFPLSEKDNLYDIVKKCWSYGNVDAGDSNIRRIMYVAKYIYSSSLLQNNMVENFQKPFILCSRRPALGESYCRDPENITYHNTHLDTHCVIDDRLHMPMPRLYREKIFNDESKQILYDKFIDNPPTPPTEDELNVFLKRFNEKKKNKSI